MQGASTLLQQRVASQASASCSGRRPAAIVTRPALLGAASAAPSQRSGQAAAAAAPRGLVRVKAEDEQRRGGLLPPAEGDVRSSVEQWLNPPEEELPDDFEMPIWDHLDELRERVLVGGLAAAAAVLTCFLFAKDLVVFLEAPVAAQGVRFLQLSPGEFFFTTIKVGGYAGILISVPTVLYQIAAYVVPGLTKSERQFLAPVILGSSVLFYTGLVFSYEVLTPAALNFFVSYADGAVESLWSIDQYFEFVLVLMLSTGLSFQVPVIQVMLGQLGLVTSQMMFSQWRYVVVGATVAAAVLTPSTDPFTQTLLAVPLVGLYMGGAAAVKWLENNNAARTESA